MVWVMTSLRGFEEVPSIIDRSSFQEGCFAVRSFVRSFAHTQSTAVRQRSFGSSVCSLRAHVRAVASASVFGRSLGCRCPVSSACLPAGALLERVRVRRGSMSCEDVVSEKATRDAAVGLQGGGFEVSKSEVREIKGSAAARCK